MSYEVFHWNYVSPNETVGVWIWGFGDNEFARFSIVPHLSSNEPPAAVQVYAQLTEDVTSRWGNGRDRKSVV